MLSRALMLTLTLTLAVHCKADDAITTTAPVPTPSTNSYYVAGQNKTCIALLAGVEVVIPYTAKHNLTQTRLDLVRKVTLGIPHDATADGSCDKPKQRLAIHFFDNWSLQIEFLLKTSHHWQMSHALQTTSGQSYLDYSLVNMTLTYVIDPERFPAAVQPEGTVLTVNLVNKAKQELPEKDLGEDFYTCNSEQTYMLDNGATLTMSHLKFKAFNPDQDRHFRGHSAKCEADKSSHWDVWYILGYILMSIVLLIIIVILYFCLYRCWIRQSYMEI